MYHTCFYASPLGQLGLAASETGLCALWLPGQKPFPHHAHFLADPLEHPVLALAVRWLDRYFAGEAPEPGELPLEPEGTVFRKLVWKLLLQVPYGTSVTYGALAAQAALVLGRERMSAQAIGGAVGSNPIAIVIPCHRCLGAGNQLTGYAGGLQLKRRLLELEKIGYIE